jgi:hypothetical protein
VFEMMMRKGCPRCHGDLYLDRNDGPITLTCLQCGRSFAPAVSEQAEHQRPVAVGAGTRDRAA